MPEAALKPKYEGGKDFQSVCMRDVSALYAFALSQVGQAEEGIDLLQRIVEIQYPDEEDADSESGKAMRYCTI